MDINLTNFGKIVLFKIVMKSYFDSSDLKKIMYNKFGTVLIIQRWFVLERFFFIPYSLK